MALVALLAGTPAAGEALAPGGDGLARVRASGVLRWGGDLQGGEPYVFQDPRDPERIVGFEVEIADALARRLGVRALFVQNDWQLLVPALERGDLDMILNGLEVTAARRRRLAFTRPYFAFAVTLVVRRADAAVRGLADLRGRHVGTLGGSLSHDVAAAVPGLDLVLYEGTEEPYLDHAIAFARQVASHVAMLVDGRIVEEGGVERVLDRPQRAETRAFLAREEEA
jgi:polar amino acid transport system substrate-binding protein